MPAQRFSKKREAILQVLRSTVCHPSAKWVFEQIQKKYPDISLATVYRNLALFKEEGQVISVAVVDGEERFDADVTPHGHFICESCGLVEDLHFEHFAEWEREVELQTHARVEYYSILFYGLCPVCRRGMRS